MSGKKLAFLLAALSAIGLALALAVSHERPGSTGTPYETFQAHRATWSSRRPADYVVTINNKGQKHLLSVRVKVSSSEVKSVEFLNRSSMPSNFTDRRYPRDVDSLFKILDEAYISRAYKIEIMFDATFGYPVRAFIDPDRDTYDDEKSFELSDFFPSHVG